MLPDFIRQIGGRASGSRRERIRSSPHFKKGQFRNIEFTPQLTEGASFPGLLWNFIFGSVKDRRPQQALPFVKTDLKDIGSGKDCVVWFGHSSYLLVFSGCTFLIDPVLSGSASPVPGMAKAFEGRDAYGVEDMPFIDYLIITHDHYDHLDMHTVMSLRAQTRNVVCGMGVGAHLESWEYEPGMIYETEWGCSIELMNGIRLYGCVARHFSGRGFKRNTTLWMSFVLENEGNRLFLGGDSGYGLHFKDIGRQFGGFDLAVLECGQYDDQWRYIHMHPEEVVQAAADLGARCIMPVHNSKFALARHAWYEPLERVYSEAVRRNMPIATPIIGESVLLADIYRPFTAWWKPLIRKS